MRRWWIWAAAALGLGAVAILAANRYLNRYLRDEVVAQLQQRYDSDVDFRSLKVRVFPRIHARGEGFVLRHRGRRDVPPLITIDGLQIDASLLQLVRSPRHVALVRFDGLRITIPPGRDGEDKDRRRAAAPVVVDELVAERSHVLLLPKNDGKHPLRFDIHRLRMQSVGLDRAAPFEAVLTNPKPKGRIETEGRFGPWNRGDPGLTPLVADYSFENADLGTFRRLDGTLSSTGKFGGILRRIEVHGKTYTPDFRVSGNPVPLETTFRAIVDGTDGDTLLQPVRARVIESSITAWGGVVRRDGDKGKTVALDVTAEHARLQDLLRLAVKGQPPMSGSISFKTRFELPPGKEEIAHRLRLHGQFGITAARFSSDRLQGKIAGLSRRGRGKPKENVDPDNIVSDLKGRFVLRGGIIRFSDLTFGVPGALVRLDGTYGLQGERLNFAGTLRLEAKPSQTTTGVKSFFLKLVDPLVHENGKGTVLPIQITGTRTKPDFGLGSRRVPGN
jgi:hypothetical protein